MERLSLILMSSENGPNSGIGGLVLLEWHQHRVESCVHRYTDILLKFKRSANATSRDAICISSFSSK